MSQLPPDQPYIQGYGTPSYYIAPTYPRPGAVTGLAIAGIVMGSLGLFCRGCGAISAGIMLSTSANPFAPGVPMTGFRPAHYIAMFGAVVDLLFWIVLLLASIGALHLKPMARRALLGWSVAMIVWQMIWFTLQVSVVIPSAITFARQMPASQTNAPGVTQMMGYIKGIQIGQAAFMLILVDALPVLLLIMWNRPNVKAAFASPKNLAQMPPPPQP